MTLSRPEATVRPQHYEGNSLLLLTSPQELESWNIAMKRLCGVDSGLLDAIDIFVPSSESIDYQGFSVPSFSDIVRITYGRDSQINSTEAEPFPNRRLDIVLRKAQEVALNLSRQEVSAADSGHPLINAHQLAIREMAGFAANIFNLTFPSMLASSDGLNRILSESWAGDYSPEPTAFTAGMSSFDLSLMHQIINYLIPKIDHFKEFDEDFSQRLLAHAIENMHELLFPKRIDDFRYIRALTKFVPSSPFGDLPVIYPNTGETELVSLNLKKLAYDNMLQKLLSSMRSEDLLWGVECKPARLL